MKKLFFFFIILIIGCSPDLYPTQHFDNGYRVKNKSNNKQRKQIQQYDNCGIFKRN